MPQGKQVDRDRATRDYVEVAFDDAFAIREEYSSLVARRRANREALRGLEAQGKLTDEQVEELDELYPRRVLAAQEAEESTQGAAS